MPIVAPAASLLGCIFVPQRVRASTASQGHAPSAPGAPSAPPGSHSPTRVSPTRVSPTEVPAPEAPAPEVLPVVTGSVAGVGQDNRVSQHRPGPEDHFSVLVRTRVEACAAAGTSMPALHVFPEGTTSNGTAVGACAVPCIALLCCSVHLCVCVCGRCRTGKRGGGAEDELERPSCTSTTTTHITPLYQGPRPRPHPCPRLPLPAANAVTQPLSVPAHSWLVCPSSLV